MFVGPSMDVEDASSPWVDQMTKPPEPIIFVEVKEIWYEAIR